MRGLGELHEFFDRGGGVEEGFGVGVTGIGEDRVGRALLDDAAQIHYGDPVGEKAFRLWATLNTGDKWLALVPGTPDVILAAFREAFDKLAAEPEFMEQGARISEGFAPMSARDVESVVATLADTPAEAVDFTKAMMRRQGLRIQ